MSNDDPIVVWHRSDLRTADNTALAAADKQGRPWGVFVFEPRYYDDRGLACDARLAFLHDCLRDLRKQYRALGGDLAMLLGDPEDRLRALLEEYDATLYLNRDVTARTARERDERVLAWPEAAGFADDGIVRTEPRLTGAGVPASREGWGEQCEAYFEADPASTPDALPSNPIDDDVTIGDLEARYDVVPEKRDVPTGGRTAARERLEGFCERLDDYPAVVSPPAAAETHSSRLSGDLKFGTLSPREVYRRVRAAPACRGREMYVSRLYWNRHYTQKLADDPRSTERAINPVFRGLYRNDHDPALVEAWKRGATGFPMVDAAMRALVETGYINFRMRAMVASFFGYVLREYWKRGADFMYYHLLDADPAVNYQQWQQQTGLVGVHPIRVYDPAKQAREYDPEGEFIRRYVPELGALPDEHLPAPAKAPLSVQAEVGIRIGEDYPYPVVDYERRADEARELFARLDDRAKEALSEPAIRARASLSQRGELEDATTEGDRGQASLDEF